MRCVYLVFASLCVATSAIRLPDLSSFFGSFNDVPSKTDAPKERVKRQDQRIGDESSLPHLIVSSVLPKLSGTDQVNERYMPTLGNGHLATTVYSDRVYLNGLYSGVGSDSHRAAIPASIMGRIRIANDDVNNRAIKKYHMNAQEGYFMETIDCDFAYIEHRLFVHKHYIRLLVSDIYWRTKNVQLGGGKLLISYPSVNVSQDIIFGANKHYHAHIQTSGRTKSGEDGKSTEQVHIFAMDPVREIAIQASDVEGNYTLIMAIDREEASARSEFDEGLRLIGVRGDGHYRLFHSHANAWRNVWGKGRVEVAGDTQLAKITSFSQYYLLSSLPSIYASQPAQHQEFVYGVSRTSLAKGGQGQDFQGHVTWDNEMYILPALVLFQPELVKRALGYRYRMSGSAAEIAKGMGAQGYKYPYRSAFTGKEVSPSGCEECENKKYHISADVSWAIRQYFSATRDVTFLNDEDYRACDVTKEIARFYASISKYDPDTGRYSLGTMTGPDESYPDRKDNAYTLAAASLAIHWARYTACMCHRSEREEVPDEWIQMALYYDLPFDNVKRRHEQFEGFFKMPGARIKQADTIMLTYPLNWNMSRDIMRHDLEYYETITSEDSPAMTWSFFTIGWKWVDEIAKVNAVFQKSYQDYIVSPFKIWTEFTEENLADQRLGSVNFLPGMGGYLQSLIYGFAGIRIRPEMLEFHQPSPPPDCEVIRLIGLQYLGTNMSIEIDQFRVIIQVHQQGNFPLVLKRNGSSTVEESLHRDAYVEISEPKDGFFIYTNVRTGCEHPRDHIYMPWGYSPFIDSASNISLSLYTIVIMLTWASSVNYWRSWS